MRGWTRWWLWAVLVAVGLSSGVALARRGVDLTIDVERGRAVDSRRRALTDRDAWLFHDDGSLLRLTFTSNGVAHAFATSAVFRVGVRAGITNDLVAFAPSTNVNVSGDWGAASLAGGKLAVRLDTNTEEFRAAVADDPDGWVAGLIEVEMQDPDVSGARQTIAQWPIGLRYDVVRAPSSTVSLGEVYLTADTLNAALASTLGTQVQAEVESYLTDNPPAGDGTNDLIATEADVVSAISGSDIAPASVTGDGSKLVGVPMPMVRQLTEPGMWSLWCWPIAMERDGWLYATYVADGGAQVVSRWSAADPTEDAVTVLDSYAEDDHNAPAVWADGTNIWVAATGHADDDYLYVDVVQDWADLGDISSGVLTNGAATTYVQWMPLGDRMYLWSREGAASHLWTMRYSTDAGGTWSAPEQVLHRGDTDGGYYAAFRPAIEDGKVWVTLSEHPVVPDSAGDVRVGYIQTVGGEDRLYYDGSSYVVLDAGLGAANDVDHADFANVAVANTADNVLRPLDVMDLPGGDVAVLYAHQTTNLSTATLRVSIGSWGGAWTDAVVYTLGDALDNDVGGGTYTTWGSFDRRTNNPLRVWTSRNSPDNRMVLLERVSGTTWTTAWESPAMRDPMFRAIGVANPERIHAVALTLRDADYTSYDNWIAGERWAVTEEARQWSMAGVQRASAAPHYTMRSSGGTTTPLLRLYDSTGEQYADITPGRILAHRVDGSDAEWRFATTNAGTWGSSSNAGDISFAEGATTLFRIDREGYSTLRGDLRMYPSNDTSIGWDFRGADLRLIRQNGSASVMTLATTNEGSWGASGGDIVLAPALTERLRIDRLGAHTMSGSLFADDYLRGTQIRVVPPDEMDPAYNVFEGLTVYQTGSTAGQGNYGAGIESTALGGSTSKKAVIVPYQYGADADQLGWSVWTSVSATQATPIEPMLWLYAGDGYVGNNWTVTNALAVMGSLTVPDATISNLTITGTLVGLDAMTLSVSNVSAQVVTGPTNYTADADTGMTIAGDLTLSIQGDIIADAALLPDANNTIDIGASGTRWRTIYAATGNITDVQAVGVTADEFVGGASGLTDVPAAELTGAIPVGVTHAAYTEAHASSHTISAAECYGGIHYVTGAATITLPAVAAGMVVTVIADGANAVSVDANAADRIKLDGTALDDGDKITSDGTAGAVVVLSYRDADGWYATTDGLWSDGGP